MKTKEQLAEELYPQKHIPGRNLPFFDKVSYENQLAFKDGWQNALANIDWKEIEQECRHDLQTIYYDYPITIFDLIKSKIK